MPQLTKRKLLTFFKSQKAIADRLDIGKAYVCQWPMDKPMPHYQELRLRHEVMPDVDWDKVQAQK